MRLTVRPVHFPAMMLAGRLSREQAKEIEFLRKNVRVLPSHFEGRIILTDDDRASLMRPLKALAVKFAIENPSWGYDRIQGALNMRARMSKRTTRGQARGRVTASYAARRSASPWVAKNPHSDDPTHG